MQRQNQNGRFDRKIGIWCNGNTTDSGPVFPGSSPGIPTNDRTANEMLNFVRGFLFSAARVQVCGPGVAHWRGHSSEPESEVAVSLT